MTRLKPTPEACPECETVLKPLQRTCHCGWVRSGQVKAAGDERQCAYRDARGRCPNVGNISRTLGTGGPWICCDHYRSSLHPKPTREISES